MYDRRAEARKNQPLSHAWCAAGSQGKWVHHTSRHDPVTGHHHGCDTIGVGLGNDVLGPFPSAKLARKVADALNEAYALGQTRPHQ